MAPREYGWQAVAAGEGPRIAGILVDIDNTLYAYDPAHEAGLSAAWAVFAAAHPGLAGEAEFRTGYRRWRTEVTARLRGQGACRSRLLAFQALLEELGVPSAWGLAGRLDRLYWDALIAAMTPNTGLIDWLRARACEGLRIGALTNMQAEVQCRKLAALGLGDLIRWLTTSEEVGREKPDPAMFAAGIAKLGLAPGQVLMLGDSRGDDIEGALSFGINACLIDRYRS